jgi:hypothetical protein
MQPRLRIATSALETATSWAAPLSVLGMVHSSPPSRANCRSCAPGSRGSWARVLLADGRILVLPAASAREGNTNPFGPDGVDFRTHEGHIDCTRSQSETPMLGAAADVAPDSGLHAAPSIARRGSGLLEGLRAARLPATHPEVRRLGAPVPRSPRVFAEAQTRGTTAGKAATMRPRRS